MVNIFVSHFNPGRAAKALPDLLCQRMCLEAFEVLNAAQWNVRLGLKPTPSRDEVPDEPYLPPYRRSLGQRRHPISQWVSYNRAHYIWLLKHAEALAVEHRDRYGGDFPAPYRDCYDWLAVRVHKIRNRHPNVTSMPASMLHYYGAFNDRWVLKYGDGDIRIQYRLQLLAKWLHEYKRKHTWRNGPPDWAYDDELLRIVRKHRGKPTTATAKVLYGT